MSTSETSFDEPRTTYSPGAGKDAVSAELATGLCASKTLTVRRKRENRERGMAVMLTAIMLLFTIPAMGLAIDAGLMYVIRGG